MVDWNWMARLPMTLALVLVAALVLPGVASAAKPLAQPLRDEVPLGSTFKDRVFASSPRTAHAALSGKWFSYPTKDGGTVQAAISDNYGNQLDTHIVQSYVDFLDSLDHGAELHTLRIFIAPPEEVLSECGGQEGTLACYDSRTKMMFVPGAEPDTGASGVTLSYIVAHEYGHHIAASRSNTPFSAFAVGPKYWASYEMVCDRSLKGLLAPGNEAQFYRSNPGEAWAETYAQLKYPEVSWQYDPILKPDAAAFDAARRDVLTPWTAPTTKVFTGTFGKRGSNTKRFGFDLTLDGSISFRLKGPRTSNYNLVLSSNGRSQGRTSRSDSRDSVSYEAACRQDATERVTVAVKRVKGSGPFTVRVSYAG
jgi:hypothetical protein